MLPFEHYRYVHFIRGGKALLYTKGDKSLTFLRFPLPALSFYLYMSFPHLEVEVVVAQSYFEGRKILCNNVGRD